MCFIQFGVVALGKILVHVGAAAFLAVGGRVHRHHRLGDQIVELERLDQIGVPDQGAVGDARRRCMPRIDRVDLAPGLRRAARGRGTRAQCGLHRPLHVERGSRRSALPPLALRKWSSRPSANSSEPLGSGRCARLSGLSISPRRRPVGAAEHDEVDQEFEPSRLAPWTETQAASPTANRPGTTLSGLPSFSVTTSP